MGKATLYIDNLSLKVRDYFKWFVAVLMVLIVIEVFMRRFLNAPTIWSGEMQCQVFAIVSVIGAGYGSLSKTHITVDILINRMSLKGKMIMELISYIVFIWPLLLASIYAWGLMAIDSWRILEKSLYSPWQPPVYPLKTLLLIGFLLFFLQTVSEVIKDIITLKRGSEKWLQDR